MSDVVLDGGPWIDPDSRADPATETGCKRCGRIIRKGRDSTGNGKVWISFVGIGTVAKDGSRTNLRRYTTFCSGEKAVGPQHAPIPVGNREALERWLDD